jgi:hypothetical protein
MEVQILSGQYYTGCEINMAQGTRDKNGLTPKMLKFCQEYVACGVLTEAYKRSYAAQNMTNKACHEKASTLMKDVKVRAHFERLNAETSKKVAEKLEITVETTVNDLTAAAEFARECNNPSAMVSAIMGRGKVLGHVIDRKDVTLNKTVSELTDDELDSLIGELDDKPVSGDIIDLAPRRQVA